MNLKCRLKGTILLESLLAMVVVMLCFGIAVMIYNNVITGSREKLKVAARLQLETEAQQCHRENQFIDATEDAGAFRVEKLILPYKESTDLFELRLTAIAPDGKTLAEYHELFLHTR
jgi:hypothetical protein